MDGSVKRRNHVRESHDPILDKGRMDGLPDHIRSGGARRRAASSHESPSAVSGQSHPNLNEPGARTGARSVPGRRSGSFDLVASGATGQTIKTRRRSPSGGAIPAARSVRVPAWRGGIWPRSTGGRRNADDSLQLGAARFGRIDRSSQGCRCALRCDRPKRRTVALRASVSSDRRAQDTT